MSWCRQSEISLDKRCLTQSDRSILTFDLIIPIIYNVRIILVRLKRNILRIKYKLKWELLSKYIEIKTKTHQARKAHQKHADIWVRVELKSSKNQERKLKTTKMDVFRKTMQLSRHDRVQKYLPKIECRGYSDDGQTCTENGGYKTTYMWNELREREGGMSRK